MKTKPLIISIFICLISTPLFSQDHGNQELTNNLSSLHNLIGQWEGEGYIIDQMTYEKKNFSQKETIYYELDSTIIMIEGQGMSGDQIVHDARAIISPSDTLRQFEFYSFLADGRKGKFLMKQNDELITWSIQIPQGELRYTITVKDNEYHEIGEYGSRGEWYPFMEMNLKKVN